MFQKQREFDSALFYFNKSLIMFKNIQRKPDIANVYNNISTSLSYLNKNNEALKYMDTSLVVCKEINDFEMLRDLYALYSKIYVIKTDYRNAYKYIKLNILYKDSLFDEDFTNKIAEMQTKYETDKKEQENLLLIKDKKVKNLAFEKMEAEISYQRKILIVFIVFFVVVAILSIFLTLLFLQKKKANNLLLLKNAEISQQKEEIETQSNNLKTAFSKIEQQNEFMQSSIRYASTIQNASLPLQTDIDNYFDNFIIYFPKNIVSGDFYFFSKVINPTSKTELFFIVSDCTGHGVPGAFMSMIGIRLLNKYVNENKISSPAEILKRLNEDIYTALKQQSSRNNDGMDLIICKFCEIETEKNYKLTFAGAKRNLFYFDNTKKEIIKILSTRKSIGGKQINNNFKFKDNVLALNKQDTLYLFSDGIIDQNNEERKRFGTNRLIRIMKENVSENMNEQNFALLSALEKWQSITDQRDDITFVALKLK